LSKSRYSDIKPILDVLPTIPLGLARVVSKAIEFDPARRYQTPGEMLADLKVAAKRVAEAKDDPSLLEDQTLLEGQYDDGQPRRLMIVESDHKMQDVFRELFKKVGYRVLVTSDPERLFQRLHDDPKAADVLLISAGQIGRDALEAFNKLGHDKRTSQLPVVLLLGEQQAAWMKEAAGGPRRLVTKMPLKSRELRHAILASLAVT
jgi:PleD family two-component response regulator